MCRMKLASLDRGHPMTDVEMQHHYNTIRPDKEPGVDDVVKHVPTARENSKYGTKRCLMARLFERWDLQRGLD
jgi:hypothetical protein